MDSGLALRAPRNDERDSAKDAIKKAGIAPGLSRSCCLFGEAYFASARFGGVAGQDLIRVS